VRAKAQGRYMVRLIFALCTLMFGGAGCQNTASAPVYSALHIVGNHFVDAAGKRVALQGVSYPHLEYGCTSPGEYLPADFAAMQSWHINAVRLPLNAPYYLNEHDRCPTYRTTLADAVKNAEAAHLYVILSLFWINPFDAGKASGAGYPMPDVREVPDFWQQLAASYAHDGHVLFEVYSEPHDVSLAVWRDGGSVTSKPGSEGRVAGDYTAIGMQALVDLIHQVAPDRIALVNTPNWGGTPGLTVAAGYGLHGANVGYTAHIYNTGPNNPHPDKWHETFGDLGDTVPVVAAEFGDITLCDGSWLRQAMPYIAAHTAGYFAWAWARDPHVCKQPSLVSDKLGTPTSYGQPIFDFYSHH
jgi:endoglucanase